MKTNRKLFFATLSTLILFGFGLSSPGFAKVPKTDATRSYTQKMVKKLAARRFSGRGYTNGGMEKASQFIASELQKIGVEPLDGKSYFQEYSHPVNTFPGDMEVRMNGKLLIPGVDYLLSPGSNGLSAWGKLTPTVEVTDQFEDPTHALTVLFKDKLTFGVSRKELGQTQIFLDRAMFTEIPTTYQVNIESRFVPDFKASNVLGVVRGTTEPEKHLLLTAHYDHLGGFGRDVFFPGANDNASGTSFILNLARHYVAHPPKYSIVFMFFGSEEAGLIGSKHYVTNPLFPLTQIRFVTNFDLVGTGVDGFTVVNATEFPTEFSMLADLNSKNKYFVDIAQRGKAANSDHYWFAENGVPAFFIYTRGGIAAYHDVFDIADTLPLDHVDGLKKLVIQFYDQMMSADLKSFTR